MSSMDFANVAGTVGFVVFIILGITVLKQWRRETGQHWLSGVAGLLALSFMAALLGFASIAVVRAFTLDGLDHGDARLITGAWPWVASAWVSGHMRWYPGRAE